MSTHEYNDLFLKLKSLNIVVYVIVVALLSYLISILCAFIFEKLKYFILKIVKSKKHQI